MDGGRESDHTGHPGRIEGHSSRERTERRGSLDAISDETGGRAIGGTRPGAPANLLTRRELEVLAMMAEGASNAKIAERLVISQSTVKSHVKNILRKLGASNRTEAASIYLRR
jgi:DNA-binding NarL/FixJ family response regulator